jgi:hypothetical protein
MTLGTALWLRETAAPMPLRYRGSSHRSAGGRSRRLKIHRSDRLCQLCVRHGSGSRAPGRAEAQSGRLGLGRGGLRGGCRNGAAETVCRLEGAEGGGVVFGGLGLDRRFGNKSRYRGSGRRGGLVRRRGVGLGSLLGGLSEDLKRVGRIEDVGVHRHR